MGTVEKVLFLLMGAVVGEIFDEQFGSQARAFNKLKREIGNPKTCISRLISEEQRSNKIIADPVRSRRDQWITRSSFQMKN